MEIALTFVKAQNLAENQKRDKHSPAKPHHILLQPIGSTHAKKIQISI
jgi:hypothetical protein